MQVFPNGGSPIIIGEYNNLMLMGIGQDNSRLLQVMANDWPTTLTSREFIFKRGNAPDHNKFVLGRIVYRDLIHQLNEIRKLFENSSS